MMYTVINMDLQLYQSNSQSINDIKYLVYYLLLVCANIQPFLINIS